MQKSEYKNLKNCYPTRLTKRKFYLEEVGNSGLLFYKVEPGIFFLFSKSKNFKSLFFLESIHLFQFKSNGLKKLKVLNSILIFF